MVEKLFKYAAKCPDDEKIQSERAFWCEKFVDFEECSPADKAVMYRHLFMHRYLTNDKEIVMEYGFKTLELGLKLTHVELMVTNRFEVCENEKSPAFIGVFFYLFSKEAHKQKL